MTPAWLLPILPLILGSATGGGLAQAFFDEPSHALLTAVVSAFMASIGVSLALMVLAIYIFRLIVYGYPRGATVASTFIPMGPLSQGGYGILLIGRSMEALLPLNGSHEDNILDSRATGQVFYIVTACIAFILWALASVFLLFALLGSQSILRQTHVSFTLPIWSIVFPNVSNFLYPRYIIRIEHASGSVCQSDDSVIHHVRFAVPPDIRCMLRDRHPCSVVRCCRVYGSTSFKCSDP